jgi:hypothetical protein
MTYRDSDVAVNSSTVSSIQFTLPGTVAVGDEIAFGVIWIGAGHTGFTPSSNNGGTFTELTTFLTDASSRAQFWRRSAISGDASSIITISTVGATTGRVVVIWSIRSGVDVPTVVLSEPASGGEMPWPAATPGGGSTSGDVVYLGVARTTTGGQSVHSAGVSGATFRETATNNGGTGNNGNGCLFDTTYASGAEVPSVTTLADPDTSGGRKLLTLLYPESGAGPAEGDAALGLNLEVAAVGARASAGTADAPLNLEVAAAGARASAGVAAFSLSLAVASSAPITPAAVEQGSYQGLLDILQLNAEEYLQALEDEQLNPVECPNDGTPLEAGPDGEPFCRFDGWRPYN